MLIKINLEHSYFYLWCKFFCCSGATCPERGEARAGGLRARVRGGGPHRPRLQARVRGGGLHRPRLLPGVRANPLLPPLRTNQRKIFIHNTIF